jgi:hypothetical protein
MKEVDYKSLRVQRAGFGDSADSYISEGFYIDGTPIEDAVLEQLTNDLDVDQMLFDRI